MRTFSSLRANCSWPEIIDIKPKKARDDAAAIGTLLHKAKQVWVQTGEKAHFAQMPDLVRGWLERLASTWSPPDDLEMEVVLGLYWSGKSFEYVPAKEDPPDSHIYLPLDPGATLTTAGRADEVSRWRMSSAHILNVDDIKSGKTYLGPPRLVRQVLAQGIGATLRAKADGFIPGIYYTRTNTWDRDPPIMRGTVDWERAENMVYEAATRDQAPRPGSWCLGCWSAKDCEENPAVAA